MGTRSLTKVYEKWEQEDEATPLVCIYRQYDGYPEGMGKDLEEFLTDLHVVNGIGYKNTERIANGGGCLTAQLIEHLKAGQVGNVYIYPIDSRDCGEEYEYHIIVNNSKRTVILKCYDVDWESGYLNMIFEKTFIDGEIK